MNEYEIEYLAEDTDEAQYVSIRAMSFQDATSIAQEIRQEHWGRINSITMKHRGIVPHDISSGTSES